MEQFIKDCASAKIVSLADGEQALLIGDKVIQFKGSDHNYAGWIMAALIGPETPVEPEVSAADA